VHTTALYTIVLDARCFFPELEDSHQNYLSNLAGVICLDRGRKHDYNSSKFCRFLSFEEVAIYITENSNKYQR